MDFFRGWRQKIGCVTLVVACGFMGLWIRGHGVKDLYQFGSGHGTTFHTLVLSQHGIMWMRNDALDDSPIGWTPCIATIKFPFRRQLEFPL